MENRSFKKFMILWAGELISAIGSGITAFGLGVYVFEHTGKATSVALVMLVAFLPIILFSAPAGVLADRFDRRWMMILGDGLSVIGLAFILICMQGNGALVWQICVGVAICSIFASLLEPAYKATITDLLTEEEYSKACGLVQIAGCSKYLLSPVIAGVLLTYTDVSTLIIIDILTFAVTVSTTFIVKKGIVSSTVKKDGTFWQLFSEGGRTVCDNKGVLQLVMLMTFVTFCMGFIQTLLGPMILTFTDSKTLGIVETISSTGMLVSSLVIGMFSIIRNYSKVLSTWLFAAGMFMGLVGIRENIYMIGMIGFLFFASLPFINTSADYLIRSNIDNSLQGRAWGLIGIISQLGYVVSYGISGVLADNVFEPAMAREGIFSGTFGYLMGTGTGRGIGLMLFFAGLLTMALSLAVGHSKAIRNLQHVVER